MAPAFTPSLAARPFPTPAPSALSVRRSLPSSLPLAARRAARPSAPRAAAASSSAPPQVESSGPAPGAAYDGVSRSGFAALAASAPGVRLVPLWRTVFSDQMTAVTAFRSIVGEGDDVPAFLLESVANGSRVGRYSYVGARPCMTVNATGNEVVIEDAEGVREEKCADPWALIRGITEEMVVATPASLPGKSGSFMGGWVGYGGYDTMRYAEAESLPFEKAPADDRGLPDLQMGLYRDVIVFDHVAKVVFVVNWVDLEEFGSVDEAYEAGLEELDGITERIRICEPKTKLRSGAVGTNTGAGTNSGFNLAESSNMTKEEFNAALDRIHEHIIDGDSFQVVFSQRFQRWASVDPFSVYRSLRVMNPSPYMIYMQSKGCTLVASSPEILCRVVDGVITNRPLAGTRPRGKTPEEDLALEKEMLADAKDVAEHTMLVDLGRNDVGRVAAYGSVKPSQLMEVERYSNVMHISSTVKGQLREGLTSWDALRAQLPVGTISGAPKIRAMQIIDSLEPTRRGPYGGGIGFISFQDTMNIALALRTMVVPHGTRESADGETQWRYDLQAGAGIVLDSNNEAEYQETINKAMALNRAIDLAEQAFGN